MATVGAPPQGRLRWAGEGQGRGQGRGMFNREAGLGGWGGCFPCFHPFPRRPWVHRPLSLLSPPSCQSSTLLLHFVLHSTILLHPQL